MVGGKKGIYTFPNSEIARLKFEHILPCVLAGPYGIRVGWRIEINGIFEAASVGPPSGVQAATSVPYI